MSMKSKRSRRRRRETIIFTILILVTLVILGYFFFDTNVVIHAQDEEIQVTNTDDEYEEAKATWLGIDISNLIEKDGEVDFQKPGKYVVKYHVKFSTKSCEKTVVVKDAMPPEITLVGESDVVVQNISEYEELGYEAKDNVDGDITGRVKANMKQVADNYYEIEYYVEDSSGNKSTCIRKVMVNAGTVFLTFDDGPSEEITPEILDILKEKNVKATFFLVGYGENKEEIVKRIYDEGHSIGLHGFSHDYSVIYQSVDALMNNFMTLQEMVKTTTGGYESNLIRFPGGTSNTVSRNYCVGIMSQATVKAGEYGYVYFDWNVDSNDAGGAKTADEIYQNVISGIQPGRNNVVLMHDSSGHTATKDALEKIIDYCILNGYQIKSITEDTVPVTHNPNN